MNNFDRAKENMYKTKLQQLERKLNEADEAGAAERLAGMVTVALGRVHKKA